MYGYFLRDARERISIKRKLYIDMPTVEFEGETFITDEEGFLEDLNNWNEAWAQYIKRAEGITELTEDHWRVLSFLQDYYRKNGKSPRMGVLTRGTGFRLKYIYELFPSGPGKGACRMAGLPKPAGCI
jgi:tRNA 2-thiouridine synthesizing protein E